MKAGDKIFIMTSDHSSEAVPETVRLVCTLRDRKTQQLKEVLFTTSGQKFSTRTKQALNKKLTNYYFTK